MFAWSHNEMSRIEFEVMAYCLNVDVNYKSVWQKRHVFTPKRYEIIQVKVEA